MASEPATISEVLAEAPGSETKDCITQSSKSDQNVIVLLHWSPTPQSSQGDVKRARYACPCSALYCRRGTLRLGGPNPIERAESLPILVSEGKNCLCLSKLLVTQISLKSQSLI